ncbi:MAG: glutaminyl-peptide cyclotransferase [Thermodesulfobacteriota bacterium]
MFELNKKSIKIFAAFILFIICLVIFSYSKTESLSSKQYTVNILNTYPHDNAAFTQGLVFDNGYLYESTGLHGKSSIRKVEIDSGRILMKRDLSRQFFGEGITILDDKIYQITWRSKTGFIYDKKNFNYIGSFSYQTEGWGITQDGKHLIISDGSSKLYFMDPSSYKILKILHVKTIDGKPIIYLNELEYIDNKIYSNIWQSDKIVVIDPITGIAENWIDLSPLKDGIASNEKTDVLNGIAYNPDSKTFYITGKLWPKLFEIELKSN